MIFHFKITNQTQIQIYDFHFSLSEIINTNSHRGERGELNPEKRKKKKKKENEVE